MNKQDADELGSGMRNTNKYTKLYSGGTPVFVEDNIFEIVIPMGNVAEMQVGPSGTQELETSKETMDRIVDILRRKLEISIKGIAEELKMSVSGVRYHIDNFKKEGIIEHTGSTKKGKWIVH